MAKDKTPPPPKSDRQVKLEALHKTVDYEDDDWFDKYVKRVRDEIGPFIYVHVRRPTEGSERMRHALEKLAEEVLTDPGFYDAGGEQYLFIFDQKFSGEPLPEF